MFQPNLCNYSLMLAIVRNQKKQFTVREKATQCQQVPQKRP